MNDDLSEPVKRDALAAPLALEIDSSVLDDVCQAIGAEQMGACVESVVADIGHLIERLKVRGSPDAFDAIGRAAHHLSGGCRSLGFMGIGAVCARIEADAHERVDHRWPAYSVELAQQGKALSDWWSTAAADPRLSGACPPE